jgi:ubiquinone/menaquinone biosynthesis C-methylase UbiE
MIDIIVKILSSVNVTKSEIIDVINESHENDKKILDKLTKLVKTIKNPYNESDNFKRAFRKWKFISPSIDIKINAILDYGGGVGDTAYAIGNKVLRLPPDKIFVIDVDEFGGIKYKPRPDISFIHFDNIENMHHNVDLIMINHVMHHIKESEYDKIIKLFNRILSKNGIISLYEHDCSDNDMSDIINLEHMLYDVCVAKKLTYTSFIKTFYAKYMPINKWKILFSKYFSVKKIIKLNNMDNSFYIIFKRAI